MTAASVVGLVVPAGAQVTIRISPDAATGAAQDQADTEEQLINWVFEPVTARLKLTGAQKFKILIVAQATINSAQPLFEELDDLDHQLALAEFSEVLDEGKLQQLLAREGELTSQINTMMARAKTNLAKILTAAQRQIVIEQYQRPTAHLGALSSVGN